MVDGWIGKFYLSFFLSVYRFVYLASYLPMSLFVHVRIDMSSRLCIDMSSKQMQTYIHQCRLIFSNACKALKFCRTLKLKYKHTQIYNIFSNRYNLIKPFATRFPLNWVPGVKWVPKMDCLLDMMAFGNERVPFHPPHLK